MEGKLDFKIRFSSKVGMLGVVINGIGYTYYLDAGFIPKIEKRAKHAPGKALAFLKEVSYHYERR